jgi:hypothetical protein
MGVEELPSRLLKKGNGWERRQLTILEILDLLTQSRSENLGQAAVKLIETDFNTAIIGSMSTQAIFFATDLAIDIFVSWGYVVFSSVDEVSLLEKYLFSRASCGIILGGNDSFYLLKDGLLHGNIRERQALFRGRMGGHSVKGRTQGRFASADYGIYITISLRNNLGK